MTSSIIARVGRKGAEPWIILLAIAVSASSGYWITQPGLDWRFMLVAAVGLTVGLVLLIPRQNVLRFGLYLWIASFGLGFRNIEIAQRVSLHPAEAILWFLFLALLVRKAVFGHSLRIPRFTYFGWGFLALIPVGALVALWRDTPWALVLRAMKPTLGIIPAFYVVYNLVEERSAWLRSAAVGVLIGAYISLLGIVEYLIPNFALPFEDFLYNEQVLTAPGGFRRGMFAFWGSPIAVLVPLIFFPWLLIAWNAKRSVRWRVAAGGLIPIYVVALYISAYRGLWLSFLVMLLAYGYVGGRQAKLATMLAVILGWQLLPTEFYDRINELFVRDIIVMGDTRLSRFIGAWNLALRHPLLGVGWGGSGWVHSDWLQIAADLGFPAALCLLAWYGTVVLRVRDVARGGTTAWTRAYAAALFISLVGIAVALALEAMIVRPELIFPVWFVFALASKLGEDEREND